MPDLIKTLLPFFGILMIIVIAVSVISILARKRQPTPSFPYRKQDRLFTPAERSFLGVLNQAVGDQYHIFGKVRLADVIKVKKGLSRPAQQSAFNKIQSKHLDYVVCDPGDLSIQFVVELDDSSHGQSKRKSRDAFLDQALKAADVNLYRFPAKRAYSVHEVKDHLFCSSKGEGHRSVAAPISE